MSGADSVHRYCCAGRIVSCLRYTASIVVAVLVVCLIRVAIAAPGDLDPSFGNGGVAIADALTPIALAIQPDGKIVVGGRKDENGMYALARFDSNGVVDNAFGSRGVANLGYQFELSALAFQADGKILIAGHDFLARLTSMGELDTSFGGTGVITSPLGVACLSPNGYCTLAALTVDANDRIVASGSYGSISGRWWISDLAVARYDSSGSPDASFNGTGVSFTDFEATDRAVAVLLQPDSKSVVAGTASPEPTFGLRFVLARFNSDGSVDSTFGSNGQVVTTPGGIWASAGDAVLQPDGKIIVVGSSWSDNHFAMTIVRYNPAGGLDPTFGSAGIVTNTALGFAVAAALQQDGKLLVLDGYFHLARYQTDGQIDTTFGIAGMIGKPIDTVQTATGLAMQSDGRFIVAGAQSAGTAPGSMYETVLARYQNKLLKLQQTVTTLVPEAGQLITYTFTLENADALTTTQVAISDTLPSELIWTGLLQMEPPLSSTIGSPPLLVSNLTLAPWQVITVTFPMTVAPGLVNGAVISNRITVLSAQTPSPLTSSLVITTPGPPLAAPDYALTAKNTPVVINVLINDRDPNNDPLRLIDVGLSLSGTTTMSGSDVIYTPTAGFAGYDTFTYALSDERFTTQGQVIVSVPEKLLGLYLPYLNGN